MSYRSPGVYVEEVSLFPPSVAEVETAIPAFVGYTEKAEFKGKPLQNEAVEVSSLVEFKERFGGAPLLEVEEVVLDENNNVSKVKTKSSFYMFDAIQLYFANGGGRCYVVSVGTYSGPDKSDAAIQDGLDVVAKEDEPTMLLFPDAPLLGASKLYGLQKHALKQADDLMDRFVIMDLMEDPAKSYKENYEDFRNNIGINSLSYGAAYTPHLKARLPKSVFFRQVKDSLKKYESKVKLEALTEEGEVKATIGKINNLLDDEAVLLAAMTPLKGGKKSLEANYLSKVNTFKANANAAAPVENTVRANFKDLCSFCYDILDQIYDELAKAGNALNGTGNDSLSGYLTKQISDELAPVATKLNRYVHNAQAKIGGTTINKMYSAAPYGNWEATQWGADTFDDTKVQEDNDIYPEAASKKVENMLAAEKHISAIFKRINGALGDLLKSVSSLENAQERLLLQQLPVYKNIVSAITDSLTAIPPSGAMAGVYCTVDKSRGVWKAPANISLAGVDGVTVRIDNPIQDLLNIDVNAGKSINAIRPFAGKGLLVWGARTLAGNDNEWRYISVRRFFNMVEESVKKSTYWAVFEPNDANLWIKVKAMIDNYLVLKWRQGALAGATPEDAFFVRVGLGQTMSSQDILEGRLIVDIGMAVVRPAEFIILRFMHKMQES